MKKVVLIIIIVLAVLIVVLGGILLGSKKDKDVENTDTKKASLVSDEPKEIEEENNENDEYKEQVEVIANNYNTWSNIKDYANDTVKFAVTDLNHNDRLEVIVSQMGGTGNYSYNYVYEVSKSLSSLDSYKINVADDSHADLSLMQKLDSYYDETNNIYYYNVSDTMKSSPSEYYEGTYTLSLKNGIVEQEILASKLINYEDGEKELVFYMDKNEKNINKSQFDAYVEDFYKGFKKSSVKLNWNDLLKLNNMSKEEKINEIKKGLSL